MTRLARRLRAQILAHGAISVAEFMQAALLDPEDGYYTTKAPFGAQGDFITAPEVSQVFGELIGLYLADAWTKLDSPRAAWVEIGPGRGTLMRDALRATRNIPGFHANIRVHLIEASPALIKVQKQALQAELPTISWHKDLACLPAQPLLLIANEWLDALPTRQYVSTPQGWRERLIGWEEKAGFCFELSSAIADIPQPIRPEGSVLEQCQPAQDAIRSIARHIKRHGGAAVLVDYGYLQGNADTLQAVKSHQYHPPLQDPGTADLTAHVDFGALLTIACEEGVAAEVIPQGQWLRSLGAELRALQLCKNASPKQKADILFGIERLIAPTQMGKLFKVLLMSSPLAGEGASN